MRRGSRLVAAGFALLALLVTLGAGGANPRALKAGVFDPARAAPELALQSTAGGTLTLEAYRGKVVLLGFGFSSCPQVCPTTLAMLAQARRKLGSQAAQLQVVYVTVDPQRDDAARMRAYLEGFDTSFVGGTGSAARLAAVRKAYGVMAEKKPLGQSYSMAHSTSVYLIDRRGLLRGMMPYGRLPDDYVHDVRLLLAE
jgi:protein SCO1/2